MSKKYTIVTTVNQLNELKTHIQNNNIIAYDVESTGLNPRQSLIIGISVCGKVGEAFYIPSYVWNKKTEYLDKLPSADFLPEILALLATKKLIMHNASFDCRITKNDLGVDLVPSLYADTMLLKHTVDEEKPFGLKEIAIRIQSDLKLNVGKLANQEQIELKENIKANGGSTTKTNLELYKGDLELIGKYGAADADLTLRVYNYYIKKLYQENLESFFFDDEVMPLYKTVTIPMEENGILLDIPKIKKTNEEIVKDMATLEAEIQEELSPYADRVKDLVLSKICAISNGGKFGQKLAEYYNLKLPKTKTGKYSLTRRNLESVRTDNNSEVVDFLLNGSVNSLQFRIKLGEIQEELYKEIKGTSYYVNLKSKDHLSMIFFDELQEKPIAFTPTKKPAMNKDTLEHLSLRHKAAELIVIFNKLVKIKSAYIDRFLRENEDGYFYPVFKQHGTISGRYGSDLQQLNRPIEEEDKDDYHPFVYKYNNMIREFFIAEEGRIFVDADYSSLEPRCFADDAGDAALVEIFQKGYDMYSTVAIEINQLQGKYSADTSSPNYLKHHKPNLRASSKCYSLGIRYGMGEFKLAYTLNMSLEEAESTIRSFCNDDPIEYHDKIEDFKKEINANSKHKKSSLELKDYQLLAARCIITQYFTNFPKLKTAMDTYIKQATTEGKVCSRYGRVRHLPEAKQIYAQFGEALLDFRNAKKIAKNWGTTKDEIKKLRKKLNNYVNNALNFPIQSMAASIVNRASIAINNMLQINKIDGKIIANVHDQIIVDVKEAQAKEAMKIVEDCMINTLKLKYIDLQAPPALSRNFKEGH